MMKKRVFSIVMALALCLGLLPAPALAAEANPAPQELELNVGELPAGTQTIMIYKNNIVLLLDANGNVTDIEGNEISDPETEGTAFSSLTLTGRAQGIGILVDTDSAGPVDLIFNNLDIAADKMALSVMDGAVDISVEGNVSLSAPQMAISVGGRGTTPAVRLYGPGSLTVRQTQGSMDYGMIEHNSASPLTVDIVGDVRMEAPNGYLFDNKSGSGIYPISIDAGNITLSDSTGSTGFDGVTLVSSGTLSINGQSPAAKVEKDGDTTYLFEGDLDAALAYSSGNDGAVFTLLNDVTRTETLNIFISCTLDLNGHTIRNTNYHCISIDSTADVTIRSEGEINAGERGCALDVSGTAVLEGGTFTSRGGRDWPCVFVYGSLFVTGDDVVIESTSSDGYGLFVRGEKLFDLRGGTYSGGGAAIKIFDSDSKTLADLLGNDGDTRYAYFNGDTPIALQSGGKELLGTVTVKLCDHAGATAAPNNDGTTHSITCPYCGHTGAEEACAYETWVDQGGGTHKGVCVCGREKTEAHTLATNWSPVWGEREVTITYPCEKECGYAEICGKVTVSADHLEIPYGQTQTLSLTSTLPDSTFTWTVSSGQGGGEAADTPLSTESSCTLPGDWNVGDYRVSWAVAWTGGVQTVDGSVFVTVTPAALSGKPTFGSGEGKKLSEVEVTLPAGWPAGGTFAWEAGADTQVVRGTSYAYTYTSADGNYAASGSVILWAAPSTGGGGGGYIPSTPPVSTGTTTEGGTPTTETTAVPTASVSGGKATATVDTSTGGEIVKQAVANKSETVVIAPKITGDVSKTEVSIPASTVGQLGSQTSASLTVSTPVADVTIPKVGLGSLGSAGGTVTVAAEKVGNTVELSVTAGGRAVESVPGGVTLTVPAEDATPGTVAVLVHGDGAREVVRKSVAGDGSITIPLEGSAKLEIVDNSKRFDDVPATGWVAEAAAFVSSHELFQGTAPGRFSPDAPMSRGMLAVVLHNLENNPAQALTGAFADVSSGQWYAEGVAWAEAQGIIGGYGNGRFGPDDSVTREQLAVMLWRYAGSPAATSGTLPFADADKASDWALEALRWATENGIINGKGGGILDPKGYATRVETAQMLKNFMEKQ